jgi:hypothetical protein
MAGQHASGVLFRKQQDDILQPDRRSTLSKKQKQRLLLTPNPFVPFVSIITYYLRFVTFVEERRKNGQARVPEVCRSHWTYCRAVQRCCERDDSGT